MVETILNRLLGTKTNLLAWPELANRLSDYSSPYLQAKLFPHLFPMSFPMFHFIEPPKSTMLVFLVAWL